MEKNILDWIALILLIIGGLNWGLYALNQSYDLVAMLGILGIDLLVKAVYYLIALAALYTIYYLFKE